MKRQNIIRLLNVGTYLAGAGVITFTIWGVVDHSHKAWQFLV